MTKAIRELLVFVGVVLAITLLYNIVCFLVFQGFEEMYSILFFCEGVFFVAFGVLLIIFSLISMFEVERETYQPIGPEIWREKIFPQKIDQSRLDILLRMIKAVFLIIIGVVFLFLFSIYSP